MFAEQDDCRSGIVVDRSHRMREIGVGSPVGTEQVVTAPLLNARQQVLGDDHYQGLVRVTVGVTC